MEWRVNITQGRGPLNAGHSCAGGPCRTYLGHVFPVRTGPVAGRVGGGPDPSGPGAPPNAGAPEGIGAGAIPWGRGDMRMAGAPWSP